MNSLKKGEGVPLLNFEGGPVVLLLNFEEGPGVPLLNFKGVPGPIFKLWGCSRVPRPEVLLPLWHHAKVPYICSVIYYYLSLLIIDVSYPKVFYKSILLSSKNVALRNLTSLIILKNVF